MTLSNMASAEEPTKTKRQASCFSRAARRIRRALSRICRDSSPSNRFACKSPSLTIDEPLAEESDYELPEYGGINRLRGEYCMLPSPNPFVPPRKGYFSKGCPSRPSDWENLSTEYIDDCEYEDPQYIPLSLPFLNIDDSSFSSISSSTVNSPNSLSTREPNVSGPPGEQHFKHIPRGCSIFPHSFGKRRMGLRSIGARPSTELSLPFYSDLQQTSDFYPERTEDKSLGDSDALVKGAAAVTAVTCSVTNTQPARSQVQTCSSGPAWSKRVSESLPRSHSFPSLSHMTSAENNTLTRACSLPELRLEASCEQFTPDISDDEDDETYRFQCSCPGLYQCSVTGLVFHMEREGDVVYRTVPWNRKLVSQHHKQPAGPLFDIKCEQQSVCQLHLPHCQIRSTGTPQFLSVAHVNEEGIEFIVPRKITETHIIINISGFSAFGNVKDEDSPPDPVRALVLLFYRPPANPEPSSLLNVLLLPRNVVLRDVLRTRKKSVGDESYIETSPHCKLHPQQEYSLSTCPEDDTVLVDPTKAEFECDNYDNYFPSFQVHIEQNMKHMKLFLRHTTSYSVWERRVCLWSSGVNRSCGQSALNLPPDKRLWDIRSSFIEGVSAPVLKSLLDKLFEKTVMTDSEQESANEMHNKRDKARFVIDTVRKKGEAASSEMIEALCDVDPFLSEHLGLI